MIGMSEEGSTVSAIRLTAGVAEKRINETSKVTANVIFSDHARGRMAEREIFDIDVLRVLRFGSVDETPEKTEHNEWKCKITLKIRGGRAAGVVTIILCGGKLFVKTVEWEDMS
jgi:hypothetical protein